VIPGPELARLLLGRRLLIFDFDGTIADSSPLHEQAFREVLEPLGLSVDYSLLAGRSTLDAVRHCFQLNQRDASDETQLAELARRKQERGRELIATRLSAFPAAAALLGWVRPRHRLALVTSGSRATIDLALARLNLHGWFDPLLTADDLDRAKPDPQGFLEALRLAGVASDQALVFEDSDAGFQAARNAGIEVVDATALESLMIRRDHNGN
jgi:HAD superfamily hydrolase (TIGR01509 family)